MRIRETLLKNYVTLGSNSTDDIQNIVHHFRYSAITFDQLINAGKNPQIEALY